jgi:hypothetical protein
MYADDQQISYIQPKDMISECIRQVNIDLCRIFELSPADFLKLNLNDDVTDL